jgi:hypothetical protein
MEVNDLRKLMALHDACGHARSLAIVLDHSNVEIKIIIIKIFYNSIMIIRVQQKPTAP